MTTQVTTQHRQQQNRRGVRTQLLMTAITLATIGVLVLRQVRQGGVESVAPVAAGTAQSRTTEDVMPMGGLIEQYPEDQRAATAPVEERVTTKGGLAKPYTEQAATTQAAVPTVPGVVGQVQLTASPQLVYLVDTTERQRALTDLGLGEGESALMATTGEDAAQVGVRQSQSGESVIDLRGSQGAPCLGDTVGTVTVVRLTCS